jgi:hypothetical protein
MNHLVPSEFDNGERKFTARLEVLRVPASEGLSALFPPPAAPVEERAPPGGSLAVADRTHPERAGSSRFAATHRGRL